MSQGAENSSAPGEYFSYNPWTRVKLNRGQSMALRHDKPLPLVNQPARYVFINEDATEVGMVVDGNQVDSPAHAP